MKKPQAGFTIVELVVVIAVIGILAAGTIATYGLVQRDAKDTAIKTATQQVADSLKLWATRNNKAPNETNLITNGSTSGQGWVQTTTYTRTIEDVLVDAGYLNPGFSAKLESQNAGAQRSILMFYPCVNASNPTVIRYAVYASLNDSSKKADYRAQIASAGCNTSAYDTNNMNYAVIF